MVDTVHGFKPWEAVLINFCSAFIVVVAITVFVEKKGGIIGGTIGFIPSIVIPGSIGFAEGANNLQEFQASMFSASPVILFNQVALWLWRSVPPKLPKTWGLWRSLPTMVFIFCFVWFLGAFLLTLLIRYIRDLGGPYLGIFAWCCLVVKLSVAIAACWNNPPAPRGTKKPRLPILIARGFASGIAVGGSTVIEYSHRDVVAGMAAAFPAIFLTSMVALWLSQGRAVQAGAVGPMMLGVCASSVYFLVGAYCQYGTWVAGSQKLTLLVGCIISFFAGALAVSVPAPLWLLSRYRRKKEKEEREQLLKSAHPDDERRPMLETQPSNTSVVEFLTREGSSTSARADLNSVNNGGGAGN